MSDHAIDYSKILGDARDVPYDKVAEYLQNELPYVWLDAYVAMTPWPPNPIRVMHGTFEYLFDAGSENQRDNESIHDRLICVIGRSKRQHRKREHSRIAGWIGKTETIAGSAYDKGHFIAHSIGGFVDGSELNLFWQTRAFNRGQPFREMERYAAGNEGTLVFNRPIYLDDYSVPGAIDYGVLRTDNTLWVQRFKNI